MEHTFSMYDLMEWVEVLCAADKENKRVCVFTKDLNGLFPIDSEIPAELLDSKKVAVRRVAYLDESIPDEITDGAYHIGYVAELGYEKMNDLAALFTPHVVGTSEDGFVIIIGEVRNRDIPANASKLYSPEQVKRLLLWLILVSEIDIEQEFVIIEYGGDSAYETRDEIMEMDFIDEYDGMYDDILEDAIFVGTRGEISADVMDKLTYKDTEQLFCSHDGVLVLLCTDYRT